MFDPLLKTEEKRFRDDGTLVVLSVGSANYGECTSIPHKMVYNSINGRYDVFIFDATFTANSIIVEDLTSTDNLSFNEPLTYMFLGWAVERLKAWAELIGKKNLILTSKMSHITEWLVEHKYRIKSVEKSGGAKRFLGATKIERR